MVTFTSTAGPDLKLYAAGFMEVIQFVDGVYETDDPRIVRFLELRPQFALRVGGGAMLPRVPVVITAEDDDVAGDVVVRDMDSPSGFSLRPPSGDAVEAELATHEALTTTAHGGIVAEGDPRLASRAGGNLQTNSSFEYAIYDTGWVLGAGAAARERSIVHDKGASYRLRATAQGAVTYIYNFNARPAGSAGRTYIGSAWVYCTTATTARLILWGVDASGNIVGAGAQLDTPIPANTWTRAYTPSLTLPAGSVTIRFQIQWVSPPNTTDSFYIDDTQIEEGAVATPYRPKVPDGTPIVSVQSEPVVSVLDYGATGNGITDDTAAIQAALDAAGKIPVYFPRGGIYLVSAPLRLHAGQRIRGDHAPAWMPDSSRGPVIQAAAGFTGTSLLQVFDKALTGEAASPTGGRIEGLCLNGNSATVSGIYWQGDSADWTIRDVEVMSCQYGYRSEGAVGGNMQQDLNFFNCFASLCSGAGWYFLGQSFNHLLHACVSHTNGGAGFLAATNAAGAPSSIQFDQCRAEWNGLNGFDLTGGSKNTLVGCVTDANSQHGIRLSGGLYVLLSGCFLSRDGRAAASYAGVRIEGTNPVLITGLLVWAGHDDFGGGGILSPQYGLDVAAGSTVLVQGYLAGAGAAFRDAGGSTIHFSGTTALNTNGAVTYQAAT